MILRGVKMKEKKLAQYMVSFGFSYRVNFLLAPLNLAKSQFLYIISYLTFFSDFTTGWSITVATPKFGYVQIVTRYP